MLETMIRKTSTNLAAVAAEVGYLIWIRKLWWRAAVNVAGQWNLVLQVIWERRTWRIVVKTAACSSRRHRTAVADADHLLHMVMVWSNYIKAAGLIIRIAHHLHWAIVVLFGRKELIMAGGRSWIQLMISERGGQIVNSCCWTRHQRHLSTRVMQVAGPHGLSTGAVLHTREFVSCSLEAVMSLRMVLMISYCASSSDGAHHALVKMLHRVWGMMSFYFVAAARDGVAAWCRCSSASSRSRRCRSVLWSVTGAEVDEVVGSSWRGGLITVGVLAGTRVIDIRAVILHVVAHVVRPLRLLVFVGATGVVADHSTSTLHVVVAVILACWVSLLVRHQVALEGEFQTALAFDWLSTQFLVISNIHLHRNPWFQLWDSETSCEELLLHDHHLSPRRSILTTDKEERKVSTTHVQPLLLLMQNQLWMESRDLLLCTSM